MTRYQALTLATVLGTLTLIAVGSLVRTTGSGLGCPDWPLCHGGLLPPLERTAIIEYSHRSVAALVGFLIIGTAIATIRLRRADRAATTLAAASLPLLAMQAWLGKETVERELPSEIVAFHLSTAMLLLALLALIAAFAFMGPRRRRVESIEHGSFVILSLLAAIVTAGIVVVGAYVVGSDAGFACSTWPTCAQAPVPFLDGGRLQHIHWVHRLTVLIGGVAIVGLVAYVRSMRSAAPWVVQGVTLVGALYAAQVVSGALNIWSDFAEAARILHLTLSGAIWAVLVPIAVAGRMEPDPEPEAGDEDAHPARREASGVRV